MLPTPPPLDRDLLDRYLANPLACTPDEHARITAWLQHDGARESVVSALRTWSDGERSSNADVEQWLAHIKAHEVTVPASEHASDQSGVNSRRRTFVSSNRVPSHRALMRWIGVGVVGLAAIGMFADHGMRDTVKSWSQRVTSQRQRIYVTAAGQRATITLADGSKAVLGPASRMSVTGRAVALQGEAYFTVASHDRAAFTVEARGVIAQVLGTAFDMRAYADDPAVHVMVTDGKVALRAAASPNGRSAIVTGGEHAVWTSNSVTVKADSSVHDALAWMHGQLVFYGTPLPEVLQQLDRYGIHAQLGDRTLATRRLSATINTTGDDVLGLIAISLRLRTERRDGRVVFFDDTKHP